MLKIKKGMSDLEIANAFANQINKGWDWKTLQQKALDPSSNTGQILDKLRAIISKQVVGKMLEIENKLLKYVNFVEDKGGAFTQIIATGMARLSQFIQYLDVNEHYRPEEIEQLIPTQFFDTVEIATNDLLMRDVGLNESGFVALIKYEASTRIDVLSMLGKSRLKKAFEQLPIYYKVDAKVDGDDPSNKLSAEKIYGRNILNDIWLISDYMEEESTLFNSKSGPSNTPKSAQTIIFNSLYFGKASFALVGDTYNFKDIKNGGVFADVSTYPGDKKIIAIIIDSRHTFYLGNVADKETDQFGARTNWKDEFTHQFKKGGQVEFANSVIICTEDLSPVTDSVWDWYDVKGKLIKKFEVTRKDITTSVKNGDIGVKIPFYIHSVLQNNVSIEGAGDTPTEKEIKDAIKLANPKFEVDNVDYKNITAEKVDLYPKSRADSKGLFYYAMGVDVGYPRQKDYFKLKFSYKKKETGE